MSDSYFMIRFGELSTKGENKKIFIDCLYRNIKHALKPFPNLKFEKNRDHIFVRLNEERPDDILPLLQEIPGIQRISLVVPCPKEQDKISELAVELVRKEEGKNFKIETKRIDKTYPLKSYDICVSCADAIIDNLGLEVDVHNPDIVLHVEIGFESAFLYCHEYEGAGGYPLGMNGKVLLLLSGGIDSPVAAYSLLRRGIKIECLHFASPPYTSEAVLDKLKDLLDVMNAYQERIKLNVAPFTKIQESIYKYVDEPYCITEMRRMMMRIAERVAKKTNCKAIATGESIGQVASQTLDSMVTINDVTNFPIIRPLAVEDKVKIINTAKRIGTFEISIRPYEDCCTIFKPKKPKTKPRIDECEFFEKKWDWASQIDECVASIEKLFIEEE
ncbi:MAG: tRNA 4-thiouridine(8) synthase ThiI [Bacilli bacterium]|nr:tRNA 4-thiouridine(8) synthase ThiI [Bacilli bacterium]